MLRYSKFYSLLLMAIFISINDMIFELLIQYLINKIPFVRCMEEKEMLCIEIYDDLTIALLGFGGWNLVVQYYCKPQINVNIIIKIYMIGVIIGIVFSAIIFTVLPQDKKAVQQYKKKKSQQQKRKRQQQQKRKEQIKRLQNDPQIKKKRQQNDMNMRNKLLNGLNQEDKKFIQEYLKSNKVNGKSDADILKDTISKTGLFMFSTMLFIVIMIFVFVIILTEGSLENVTNQFQKIITAVYPKLSQHINQTSNIFHHQQL